MRRCFYPIVALQILFLLGEAGTMEMALRRGRLVTLKTAPVDPRSLFMGNYMALAYDISSIDLSTIAHDAPADGFDYGDPVYVTLVPGKRWAVATMVTPTPPSPRGERLYLRGRVAWCHDSHMQIDYGLERYFIPETAQAKVNRLQSAWGRHPPLITVEVVVPASGRGLIRRVLVDGKPLRF
jgi:uncharacterized membrane-anchored protein